VREKVIENINKILLVIWDISVRRFGLKKQFLPSLKDIENEELKKLVNKLKEDSDEKTLANILEWEERNIQYWNERGVLEIPWRGLKILVNIFLYIIIFTPILFFLYYILASSSMLSPLASLLLVLAIFLILFVWLIWLIFQNTIIIIICILLLSYPIYQLGRDFVFSIPKSSIIDILLILLSLNGILFGAALLTMIYLILRYYPSFRGEPFKTKFSKICYIIYDTFRSSLPISKIIEYRMAICRDYAKLTSALLFKLSNSRVYFFTILGHVAVGVKINNKYYILDQRLPILTKDSWFKRWNVKAANVYASELVRNSKGELIDVNFKKQGKEYLTDVSEKTVNTAELTEKVSKILGISQISQKEKSDFELRLKNYAVYYEADDIVEHSLIRAIKNKLENEFCSKINKISKIKINQNEKDLIVEVYL
jgi:predicted transglutaminase-like protease